jgi:TolB protein
MAFVSNRDGSPQIYISSVGVDNARRLSSANSNYCTSPSWSGNGEHIVYVCLRPEGNQLFLTTPDGANTVQLTFSGDNEDPSWSPDSKAIIYASNFGKSGNKNLAVLSLKSLKNWQITFEEFDLSQPAWSGLVSSRGQL